MNKLILWISGLSFVLIFLSVKESRLDDFQPLRDQFGAIIRGDSNRQEIFLVFTAHDFDEGYETVKESLSERKIKASFFFTGQYVKNNPQKVRDLALEGHYIGPHSYDHLLYADWDTRETLISKNHFIKDLQRNIQIIRKCGVTHSIRYFMPPYEWYNEDIVDWSGEQGMEVIDFTPGLRSHADFTYPEMEERYVPSEEIMKGIFVKEKETGLNGYIILVHLGTDPRRTDKLYDRLPSLLLSLEEKGYRFCRIDQLEEQRQR